MAEWGGGTRGTPGGLVHGSRVVPVGNLASTNVLKTRAGPDRLRRPYGEMDVGMLLALVSPTSDGPKRTESLRHLSQLLTRLL